MNFRLTTLLYLFALLAAALAAFGAVGLIAVVSILVSWSVAFNLTSKGCVLLLVWGFAIVILAAIVHPAVTTPREAARSNQCLNNMKQLTLAIINYESAQKHLPAAFMESESGERLYSWRVTVLPFIEGNHIYKTLELDQSWNSPANSTFAASVWEYQCPSHTDSNSYFAITGERTAWGDGETRSLANVTDGRSQTILLIEAAGRGVDWKEPRELTFDEAVKLLTTPIQPVGSDGHVRDHGYFYKPSFVRNVGMCDGSVRAIRVPLKRDVAVALLTANGGEQIDEKFLEEQSQPQLDFGVVWAFSVFVLLAVLPGVPSLRPYVWPVEKNPLLHGEGER